MLTWNFWRKLHARYLFLYFLVALAGCEHGVELFEAKAKMELVAHGLKENIVKLEKAKVHFWKGGKGPNLLLIHGFGADATLGWHPQVKALSKRFHLIMPDLLWFGESKPKKEDYTIDYQVAVIKDLLDYLQIKKTHIAGISYGSAVTIGVVQKIPKRFGKVVLVASPGVTYDSKDYAALLKRFEIENLHEIILPTTSKGLDRLFSIAYQKPPFAPKFIHQAVLDRFINRNRSQKIKLINTARSDMEQLCQRTYDFKNPVLLVWGSDDPIFPLKIGRRSKDFFADQAKLVVIEGARHAPNIEFSKQFNRHLLKFL